MLHRSYEQLLLRAALDPIFGDQLVADPCRSALEAGCSPMLAESLVGIQATTLADFASALHRRIYGYLPLRADAVYRRRDEQPRANRVRPGPAFHRQLPSYPQAYLA